MAGDLTDPDGHHLLACILRAEEAAGRGNFPFAALLVDRDGRVLAEAENTVATSGDATGHAELNLVRIASPRIDRNRLGTCTVYASAEPCAMCAAAMYWANIRRVVYALGGETLRAIVGGGHPIPTLSIGCREIFERSAFPVDVSGPHLEQRARAAHDRFWIEAPMTTA